MRPMHVTKRQEAEQAKQEAIVKLRELFPPGSTVPTILRHVSRSGMQRSISVLATYPDGDVQDVSYLVARAVGLTVDQARGGVKVGGCGMDMGFHLVYSLSYVLNRNGFGCVGERCPSNDHSNGDRDYTPHPGCGTPDPRGFRDHWHNEGGYALRQRWL